VLDFLLAMDMEVLVPTEKDTMCEASQWEIRERRKAEEERRAEAKALDAEDELCAGPVFSSSGGTVRFSVPRLDLVEPRG